MADANPQQGITKLWRIRRTVGEMLHDRGYVVSAAFRNESRADFQQAWEQAQADGVGRERFVILCSHKDNTDDKILVYFPDDSKRVGVKPIRILAEKMTENDISHAILVVRQSLTPFAKSAIAETLSRMRIEVFHENELVINITKHELVPTHVPLTAEEKRYLLERYQLKPSQLPRIQMNDPIARYFGLEKEKVVKVIRPSETAGRYVTYRLVV
ncbi:unnamed protein product [Amoebophrya sp. A120]|nr:unnamed protein product [Amoebophrya sp. A120]|eukprot:GSA120T00006551001.1